jgi:hypothetical protein
MRNYLFIFILLILASSLSSKEPNSELEIIYKEELIMKYFLGMRPPNLEFLKDKEIWKISNDSVMEKIQNIYYQKFGDIDEFVNFFNSKNRETQVSFLFGLIPAEMRVNIHYYAYHMAVLHEQK